MLSTQWIRELTTHPAEEIIRMATHLSRNWEVTHRAVPQSGLAMLKLKDGAFNDAFYLGEFPLSTVQITLSTVPGQQFEGAASLMSEQQELVEALAICDVILRHQLDGIEVVQTALQQGREQIAEEERIRRAMLLRTRVDFSLLSMTEEDEI